MNAPYLGKAKVHKEKDMHKFNSKMNKILDQKVCELQRPSVPSSQQRDRTPSQIRNISQSRAAKESTETGKLRHNESVGRGLNPYYEK